ncbi:spore germination protein KC [Paenibacillus phyllosphaerae]|uniref:Spore germination protein KC n=1 Tax=Paenibacillus phyllosphaerae TaxID=274593 RepID=A0A7W5AZP1_9BACL|nr:Ger(x)C family spore germination protein [Paenibacillus phyllosphaerae]MBB3111742.1 spore germination protein KC [Paenibacillus phyllosphaerae]
MRRIIKLLPLLWLLASSVLLTSCWDRTELNDLALITMLAIDRTEEGGIRTSAQIIIPQNQRSGAEGGGGEGKKTIMRSEQGMNISDALSRLQRKVPRKLFWGQCKVFLIGEDLAKTGLKEHFDFLVRHPQPRERAYIFISKGPASDALELIPPIERNSSEALRELAQLQISLGVTLEETSIMLKRDSDAFALPYVTILKPSKSEDPLKTIPYIKGTAMFKNGRMIGALSEKETQGVMWVLNEIEDYTVTFNPEGKGAVSLKPVKADVKLKPLIKGDKWSLTVSIRAEGDIEENNTQLDPVDPKIQIVLEQAFKDSVRKRIEQCINQQQHRWNADIFDFAGVFHRKYPKQWEKHKGDWDSLFPKIAVSVQVEAHILRPGLVNVPGGMPQEEVIH